MFLHSPEFFHAGFAMTARLAVFSLAALAIGVACGPLHAAPDCSVKTVPQPLPLRLTALPPLSAELPGSGRQLGAPEGLLAYASNEVQSVDRVLLRLRLEGCQNVSQAAGYVPRTKWDNTPWRFNAGADGKKFTAADFDAWMAAHGVHISKGSGAASAAQPQPPVQQSTSESPNN
jgi:hypothetical protein